MADKDSPTWGYSKDDSKIFEDGVLPDGYYPHPAMVPGSEAEKAHRADAEREGAPVVWDTPVKRGPGRPKKEQE